MHYLDPLYDSIQISESVLIDLINSQAVQRLHGILQHGTTGLIGITQPITRFQHSMGAMLLVRRLGANVDEQIGALLHDVSHTVFSHVMDHVLDSPRNQSYHDRVKEKYVSGTDIPQILAKYGRDWHDFVDETAFSLLEQPTPRLCGDRIDYFLRDGEPLGIVTTKEINIMLGSLVVAENRIAVRDVAAARLFGYRFIACDDASWANFREVGLYEASAEAIRYALSCGIMTPADYWSTDAVVWGKLTGSAEPILKKLISLITPHTRFVWDDAHPTYRVHTKLRAIDPDILIDGQLHPLSTIDPQFATHRADYFQRKDKVWPIRAIP